VRGQRAGRRRVAEHAARRRSRAGRRVPDRRHFLNNRVRSIAPDGIITTVAGDGLPPAFAGDDGPATAASLAWPSGVAALPAGGFLVTDSGSNRVRQVGSSGPGRAVLPGRWNPGVRPPLAVLDASVTTAGDGTAPLDVLCPPDPVDRGCTGTVQILVPGSAPLPPASYDYQPGQTTTLAVPASAAAGVAGARVAVETTQASGKPGGLSQPIAISAGSAAAAAASAKRSSGASRLRRRPLGAPALVGPAPLSAREAAGRGIPVSIACPSACSAEAVVHDPRTGQELARVHLRTRAGGVDGSVARPPAALPPRVRALGKAMPRVSADVRLRGRRVRLGPVAARIAPTPSARAFAAAGVPVSVACAGACRLSARAWMPPAQTARLGLGQVDHPVAAGIAAARGARRGPRALTIPVQGRFLRTAVVRATHMATFSIHVLVRDRRGSAVFRRVAHDRLLSGVP
jgi:hypothetical protein